ncbi:XRE family transcriptional regulator [Aeromonas veronii]|uniref:XRE family transcriptional regulator n=1 Tax=Aeromonas veronii TaxID=654 RepID=UPI003F79BF0E
MSRGINNFQTGRLAQILAARRLSQAQLAMMVGVSPPTISKWNSGLQAPSAEALDRLASVVNVSAEWFTRPLLPKISKPLFRSNASAHVAARAMLAARMEWVDEIVTRLSEFVDFPELKLPVRNFKSLDEISREDIESAANECRKLWGLGNRAIPDLALAAEGNGIVLVREETGTAEIEGLSGWSSVLPDRPFILLSADKGNGFRSRFDLAHEIGHLILHKGMEPSLDAVKYKQKEDQAHLFAGAFLMPAEFFAEEIRTPVTLDSLLLVKQRYGVSVAAIIMRLYALGIIGDDEKQLLYKRRSARWGVKAEPGDDTRKPEQPRLLKRTLELLISHGVMTMDGVSGFIGLSTVDIEMLSGLPTGYLSGQSADVVQMSRLKDMREQQEPQEHSPDSFKTGDVISFSRSK